MQCFDSLTDQALKIFDAGLVKESQLIIGNSRCVLVSEIHLSAKFEMLVLWQLPTTRISNVEEIPQPCTNGYHAKASALQSTRPSRNGPRRLHIRLVNLSSSLLDVAYYSTGRSTNQHVGDGATAKEAYTWHLHRGQDGAVVDRRQARRSGWGGMMGGSNGSWRRRAMPRETYPCFYRSLICHRRWQRTWGQFIEMN